MTTADFTYKRFLNIHSQGKRNQKELLALSSKVISTIMTDLEVPAHCHRPATIQPFPGWTRLNDNAAVSPEGTIAMGTLIAIEKGDELHPEVTISLLMTISRDHSGTFVQLHGGERHRIDASETKAIILSEASDILVEQVYALTRFSADLFVAG